MARRLHPVEFVALMAMMMATVAFSIDSMLPALSDIAAELTPDNANNAQLVLSAFMIGMGVGTLFSGPLSDSFGRKTVILFCAAIYILGAVLAWRAPSLELLIMARMLQGLGAAGPRVIAIAIIRDLYAGREMAKLVSFVMMVFTIFPALAPLLGAMIVEYGNGWRSLFLVFFAFSAISSLWLATRLDEPLPVERRVPFNPKKLLIALKQMLTIPMVRLTLLVQVMVVSMMFTTISLIEPAFSVVFDRGAEFPYWFFALGAMAATSSMVNAIFVVRFGMRKIITLAVGGFLLISLITMAMYFFGPGGTPQFIVYMIWMAALYYQIGLTLGNLNALAMEPLGHIAGLAASVMGAISTVVGAVVSTLVAQTFNGTIFPQLLACTIFALIALPVMLRVGKLERVRDQ
ncbi:MFS transporter [Pseudooceanicola sediminis]|uniref:MFS-type drug efflux transporter P55 n=1 Tax=Pseudooceanicola sediminis TaxID=2211117 RepID=A0A399J9C2_9RHOB|nr:multidrug effflux MFS transporter [Pseudooceanicola sediminis]KAA2316925.1 multidrug effflux MFS transporter [Puniceibacterium sp. HSS470]RII40622.1 MFS transporter [Pseudooceanicola sediminis]|tara:strand:+ start:66104 stop:67315 length:1212 start_codon:yes stop_codon:yes gene_type:complete